MAAVSKNQWGFSARCSGYNMRFPSLTDLDREQRRIYGEAPGDGAILVVGPPGTGKTVMAFHRAQKLERLGQAPHVIMFNKVLAKYTSSRSEVAPDVPVNTMNSWAWNWWRGATGTRPPSTPESKFDYDWNEICARALDGIAASKNPRFSWGHLLIDEGQDFPPQMYMAMGIILKTLETVKIPTQVTIFADDNQRLQAERNSRISDIRTNLFINGVDKRNYVLHRNFRNTRPIAAFAGHFQVGNESGIADLPDIDGESPQVIFAANDRDVAEFIVRKNQMNPGKQVGVIVSGSKKDVKRAFNQVKARIPKDKKAPGLQMYLSKDNDHSADSLDFDNGNTITFLHVQSAKGLEFDIVFFLGLEGMSIDSSGFINERMTLYVMCSRARSELYLAFKDIDPGADLPPSSRLLPRPSSKLCRYVGLGQLDQSVETFQDELEANGDFGELEAHS